ncbi:MAG: serine O-acetyltransferase [Pseudomonadota bacterium]
MSEEKRLKRRKLGLFRQWREDIQCVFTRDPAARNTFEVITTYPGVHAVMIHRVAHRLWWRNWRYAARLLAYLSRAISNIDIHPGATIGRRFFIDHGAGVVIGETAIVGDDVTLYHGVTLGGTSWNKGRRHPTLGNGVMVGAGAKILGAITVGDGVRVGANSVVHRDVAPGKTVVGIPGKAVNTESIAGTQPYGIDLDHHLIPDPVGKAISCLVERIRILEGQLNELGDGERSRKDACPVCQGHEVCTGDIVEKNIISARVN